MGSDIRIPDLRRTAHLIIMLYAPQEQALHEAVHGKYTHRHVRRVYSLSLVIFVFSILGLFARLHATGITRLYTPHKAPFSTHTIVTNSIALHCLQNGVHIHFNGRPMYMLHCGHPQGVNGVKQYITVSRASPPQQASPAPHTCNTGRTPRGSRLSHSA